MRHRWTRLVIKQLRLSRSGMEGLLERHHPHRPVNHIVLSVLENAHPTNPPALSSLVIKPSLSPQISHTANHRWGLGLGLGLWSNNPARAGRRLPLAVPAGRKLHAEACQQRSPRSPGADPVSESQRVAAQNVSATNNAHTRPASRYMPCSAHGILHTRHSEGRLAIMKSQYEQEEGGGGRGGVWLLAGCFRKKDSYPYSFVSTLVPYQLGHRASGSGTQGHAVFDPAITHPGRSNALGSQQSRARVERGPRVVKRSQTPLRSKFSGAGPMDLQGIAPT
ncbi:hypothetical protein N658DRAFT_241715 [Parathielavia hyrcaniae]|uniref:Uncharacterized protein n=1 Tax=Parathielavia hyrcaniae TaxID=113614 RepID=A0AAN6QAV2_9PEZI|nr:hypothetical protein N658DRAFT_241715 [Parathielavia hyrcaniae]